MKIRVLALIPFLVPAVAIAVSPEDRCEARQHKIAAALAKCRHKAEANAIRKGSTPDYTQCESRFGKRWDRADAKAAKKSATCRYDDDGSDVLTFVESHTDELTSAFAGAGLPTCGDDAVNRSSEQCDGADLDGASCQTLGFTSGSLACDGSCRFDTSSCTAACPGGSTACAGTCVQLDDNNVHCGACGTVCATGTRCESGLCTAT